MQEKEIELVETSLITDELISVTSEVEELITDDGDIANVEIADDKELTDEEKKKILIEQLKKARQKFKPIKHNGNITANQFDATYKKKRAKKNKQAKKSRKTNRK